MILLGFPEQRIQSPRLYIFLKLLVPELGMKFFKPFR